MDPDEFNYRVSTVVNEIHRKVEAASRGVGLRPAETGGGLISP
jgi:hypothetical protein